MTDISVVGLPLALSIAVVVQFFLLYFFLRKKIKILDFKKVYQSLAKILLNTFLTAVFAYLTLQVFALFLNTETVFGLLVQAISAGVIGVGSYVLFSYLLKSPEMYRIYSSIKEQFKKP